MNDRIRYLLVGLLLAASIPRAAPATELLLRVAAAELDGVLERHDLTLEEEAGDPDDELYLVSGEEFLSIDLIREDPAVVSIEEVTDADVPEKDADGVEADGDTLLSALADAELVDFFGTQVWDGYSEQPAAELIQTETAHDEVTGRGAVVAVIDTGVDPDHPVLASSLVPGYDFVRDRPDTVSEWLDLDPEIAAELQQPIAWSPGDAEVAILDQSVAWILDQSVAWILDGGHLPGSFGHGTMVSGIIHLVAPEAQIMPLKAFTAEGTAKTSDIVQAIYHAVDHGADVISMSFSMDVFSPELMRAVNYAARNGVVSVASAGNSGESSLVYPAGLGQVLGVASTDLEDQRSSFSNYGPDLVALAAPGEGIVTTFPGSYAAGWGTSYSTPMVAAAVALGLETLESPTFEEIYDSVLETLRACVPLPGADLGFGRLDVAELED